MLQKTFFLLYRDCIRFAGNCRYRYCSGMLMLLFCSAGVYAQQRMLASYVNPLTGTGSSTTIASLKHGEGSEHRANIIPGVCTPFGMTQFTPQTRLTEQKCQPPYYYKDIFISGFRATHWISGSCMQDYGSFTIMPTTGVLQTNPEKYKARLNHGAEQSAISVYSLLLEQYHLKVEITASPRCGMMKITALQDDTLNLLLSPNSDMGKGSISFINKQTISSCNPVHRIYQGKGKEAGFNGYIHAVCSKPFLRYGVYAGDSLIMADSIGHKNNIGAYARLPILKNETVLLKFGTSFTSGAAALNNLLAEIPGWDFNSLQQQTLQAWEKELQKIQVTTANETDKEIFYTALYHAMFHPRLYSDVSGTYPQFSGAYKTAVLQKNQTAYYDDFSQWDIFRTQLPLQQIMNPALTGSFVQSLLLKAEQGGWLPIFPCWNSYTSAMVGDHLITYIASVYQKGNKNFDVQKAYGYMRQNAFDNPSAADYQDGKGRRALQSYLQYGYIPLEDTVPFAFHKKEQTSRTLEYAFNDYALATMALALNKKEDYLLLKQRAGNYKNVFDTVAGFVNGRYANGSWYENFNPDKKSSGNNKINFITEGTPRQYTFFVPHDVPGLQGLMGGKTKFENQLDSLFLKEEYWHGNEPGHHTSFLYNYTNSPHKTQERVLQILSEEYGSGAGGLSGNDDAGQMSAWYVMAAIGLYPVNPVSTSYAISSPIFNTVTIQTGSGKKTIIKTIRKTPASKYIQSIKVNGKIHTGYFLEHQLVMRGCVVEILLGDVPLKK